MLTFRFMFRYIYHIKIHPFFYLLYMFIFIVFLLWFTIVSNIDHVQILNIMYKKKTQRYERFKRVYTQCSINFCIYNTLKTNYWGINMMEKFNVEDQDTRGVFGGEER